MGKPVFKPSKTVSSITSGRVRDDSYDDTVRTAFEQKGKVFESEVSNEDVDDVRKGLARSALYLKVRIATDFEQNAEKGTWIVRFSAHDKMPRNGSRKPVESESAETETADA